MNGCNKPRRMEPKHAPERRTVQSNRTGELARDGYEVLDRAGTRSKDEPWNGRGPTQEREGLVKESWDYGSFGDY